MVVGAHRAHTCGKQQNARAAAPSQSGASADDHEWRLGADRPRALVGSGGGGGGSGGNGLIVIILISIVILLVLICLFTLFHVAQAKDSKGSQQNQ